MQAGQKKYQLGIEIDWEGVGGWSVSWGGTAHVSANMLNLGAFIERYRELVPVGEGLLTLDVYAAQGGNPALTYLVNRYVPGMPAKAPDWIKAGPPVTAVTNNHTLDFINIMVGGDDDAKSVEAYMDGYVGPTAEVASQYNSGRILSPVPPGRVCISMIADHSCDDAAYSSYARSKSNSNSKSKKNSNLELLIAAVKERELLGIMQWAIGTYGCDGTEPGNKQWQIGDWDCKYTPACPGLIAGKKSFLAPS